MKVEGWLAFLGQLWERVLEVRNWFSSDQTVFAVIALMLFIFVVVIAWLLQHMGPERKRWKTIRKEAKGFFRDMEARKRPPIVPVNVILKQGEVGILQESSMFYEMQAYRVHGGGTRIRGVYIGRGSSESHQRLRHIDSGRIILTTQRLIFDGQWETRMTNLNDIIWASPLEDAIEVSVGRNQKTQIYIVRNPLIWAKTIQMLASRKISAEQMRADRVAPLVSNSRDF
jgi:hypothetical protein